MVFITCLDLNRYLEYFNICFRKQTIQCRNFLFYTNRGYKIHCKQKRFIGTGQGEACSRETLSLATVLDIIILHIVMRRGVRHRDA